MPSLRDRAHLRRSRKFFEYEFSDVESPTVGGPDNQCSRDVPTNISDSKLFHGRKRKDLRDFCIPVATHFHQPTVDFTTIEHEEGPNIALPNGPDFYRRTVDTHSNVCDNSTLVSSAQTSFLPRHEHRGPSEPILQKAAYQYDPIIIPMSDCTTRSRIEDSSLLPANVTQAAGREDQELSKSNLGTKAEDSKIQGPGPLLNTNDLAAVTDASRQTSTPPTSGLMLLSCISAPRPHGTSRFVVKNDAPCTTPPSCPYYSYADESPGNQEGSRKTSKATRTSRRGIICWVCQATHTSQWRYTVAREPDSGELVRYSLCNGCWLRLVKAFKKNPACHCLSMTRCPHFLQMGYRLLCALRVHIGQLNAYRRRLCRFSMPTAKFGHHPATADGANECGSRTSVPAVSTAGERQNEDQHAQIVPRETTEAIDPPQPGTNKRSPIASAIQSSQLTLLESGLQMILKLQMERNGSADLSSIIAVFASNRSLLRTLASSLISTTDISTAASQTNTGQRAAHSKLTASVAHSATSTTHADKIVERQDTHNDSSPPKSLLHTHVPAPCCEAPDGGMMTGNGLEVRLEDGIDATDNSEVVVQYHNRRRNMNDNDAFLCALLHEPRRNYSLLRHVLILSNLLAQRTQCGYRCKAEENSLHNNVDHEDHAAASKTIVNGSSPLESTILARSEEMVGHRMTQAVANQEKPLTVPEGPPVDTSVKLEVDDYMRTTHNTTSLCKRFYTDETDDRVSTISTCSTQNAFGVDGLSNEGNSLTAAVVLPHPNTVVRHEEGCKPTCDPPELKESDSFSPEISGKSAQGKGTEFADHRLLHPATGALYFYYEDGHLRSP